MNKQDEAEEVIFALRTLPTWSVISPTYTVYGGYMEPPEQWQDYVEVQAETRSDALLLGVKMMRGDLSLHRYHHEIGRGENPFTGMIVKLVQ